MLQKKTYWVRHPRGFQNEYDIGIATSAATAHGYRMAEYDRVPRATALRLLKAGGDSVTQMFVGVSVDGAGIYGADGACISADGRTMLDRHEVAQAIRDGAVLKGHR